MFRKNKITYVTKREMENALKVDTIDCNSTAKTAAVFEELDDITMLFLGRNNETINNFRMMQKAAF